MLATSLLVSALAVFTSAAPVAEPESNSLEARAAYGWSIKKFGYGCSPGGCSWGFDIEGPKDKGVPAFSTSCSGTGYRTGFQPCKKIKTVKKGVYKDVEARVHYEEDSSNVHLFLKYEYTQPPSYEYTLYGNKSVPTTQGNNGKLQHFTITPSKETAVGK